MLAVEGWWTAEVRGRTVWAKVCVSDFERVCARVPILPMKKRAAWLALKDLASGDL